MVPLSLTLKGFLSFREEQTLDFEQDQVWLLSGPNGSGKSTVFDAILFALYAGHRAGKADLHALINKDCDRALVRFEFLLDGVRFRAERTAERTVDRKTGRAGYSGTQQLYAAQGGEGTWRAIPGTQKHTDFQEWVREHIGLSFDAFTSSALLMQGRADVLVAHDAEAAHRRFEVLARIVGLDTFERLYRQADDQRKKNEKRAQELTAQLAVIETVDPDRLDALGRRCMKVSAQLAGREEEIDRLQARMVAAARWVEMETQRAAKQRELEATAGLLEEAVTIERDGTRSQELQAVLPGLRRLVDQRKQVAEATAKVPALEAERARLLRRAADAETGIETLRQALEENQTAQAADEGQQQELSARQQPLAVALGPLRRVARVRVQLQQARAAAAKAAAPRQRAEKAVRDAEAELAPLARAVDRASTAHHEAAQAATAAKARLDDFSDQARRFAEVAGAQVCSYCGQALSPEHAERERARIAEESAVRQAAWEVARDAVAHAAREESACKGSYATADRALTDARAQADALRRREEKAAEQIELYRQTAHDLYAEIPERYRQRVGPLTALDEGATGFPTPSDLEALEHELTELAAKLEGLRQAAVKRQRASLELRKQLQQDERSREAIRAESQRTDAAISQHTERVRMGQQQLDAALAALPTRWQVCAADLDDARVGGLSQEVRQLVQQDAAGRLERLRAAESARESLRGQLEELARSLANVPQEARCSPSELEPAAQNARQSAAGLRTELSDLQAQERRLVEQRQRREQLSAEFCAADRRRHLSARLAELLSRRHLQRHLLRQAEVAIVENTNRVLDRITAGQLSVRLLPEEDNGDNRALQLEATKTGPGQSFGLSFLSGSERFRVAIGLALGIGQYASRQHRAIESVIIDEGFGCLDRDNRRTMIDELDHLRGQLRCILLVSHQEEFAEAFPDGYRFRFAEGTSTVERSE